MRETRPKADCLNRDDQRDLVTRLFNTRSIDRNDRNTGMTYTGCAYIIPLSFATWRDESEI